MTNAVSGNRRYRNPLSDKLDQILFFSFFAVGSVAIWMLKDFGVRQLQIIVVPLGLMVLYAVIALITKRYRLREDRVGDNIYYLGFLYTLVSLSYALYIYRPEGAGATDIITNFGIALGTTILGLAFRVLFNQMREDPVEYEREARLSLAEASAAMRAQLADVATDLSSFKRKIMQITEEGVVDVTKSAAASMTEQTTRFAESATEVTGQIRLAFAAFTDHATRLNEIAAKNVNALEALFNRVEKIDASPELLTRKFEPILERFDQVADAAIARSHAQDTDLKHIRDSIEVAVSASEALRSSISSGDQVLSERLARFSKQIDAVLKDASTIALALHESGSSLAAQTAAIAKSGGEIREALGANGQSAAVLRAAVEADAEAIRTHRDALAAMAAESREAVRTVEASLVTLSRTLVEQLGGR